MLTKTSLLVWLTLATLFTNCLASAGCAAFKAVDSTLAVQALTAGESNVTYTVVPGGLVGMPENTVAIPTVPGKDIDFTSYFENGQVQFSLKSKRSAVTDAIVAGIAGVDASKFAQDQATLDRVLSYADSLIDRAMAGGFIRPPSEPTQSEPSAMKTAQEMLMLRIMQQLADQIAPAPAPPE